MRILVVEDNDSTRFWLSQSLTADGHDVYGVSDAEAALRRLWQERFDLVITDYRMPGMSGLELVAIVRSCFGGQVRTIGMSASADCRRGFLDAGADFYFEKPIDYPQLLLRLGKLQRDQEWPTIAR